MNAFRTLIYEKNDGIARLTLNRPRAPASAGNW